MMSITQKRKRGISWKKTCGKTTSKMGRQNQEGFRVAEYKMMAVTRRGQRYMVVDCWKGLVRGVGQLKKKEEEEEREEDEEAQEEEEEEDEE
jgi:hypothetical protein